VSIIQRNNRVTNSRLWDHYTLFTKSPGWRLPEAWL